jgi:hypothetical protein
MPYPFKMQIQDGIVRVLDALTGRQITETSTDIVGVSVVDEQLYEDVTNYRWLANHLGITIPEAMKLYGKR